VRLAATVLSVDKAGTEGGDGAQTAIVIMHRMKNGPIAALFQETRNPCASMQPHLSALHNGTERLGTYLF
jgi:hypothetical protein